MRTAARPLGEQATTPSDVPLQCRSGVLSEGEFSLDCWARLPRSRSTWGTEFWTYKITPMAPSPYPVWRLDRFRLTFSGACAMAGRLSWGSRIAAENATAFHSHEKLGYIRRDDRRLECYPRTSKSRCCCQSYTLRDILYRRCYREHVVPGMSPVPSENSHPCAIVYFLHCPCLRLFSKSELYKMSPAVIDDAASFFLIHARLVEFAKVNVPP